MGDGVSGPFLADMDDPISYEAAMELYKRGDHLPGGFSLDIDIDV